MFLQLKDSNAFPILVGMSESVNSALYTMVNIAQLDEMLIDVGSSGIIAKIVARLANTSRDVNLELPDNSKRFCFHRGSMISDHGV